MKSHVSRFLVKDSENIHETRMDRENCHVIEHDA